MEGVSFFDFIKVLCQSRLVYLHICKPTLGSATAPARPRHARCSDRRRFHSPATSNLYALDVDAQPTPPSLRRSVIFLYKTSIELTAMYRYTTDKDSLQGMS